MTQALANDTGCISVGEPLDLRCPDKTNHNLRLEVIMNNNSWKASVCTLALLIISVGAVTTAHAVQAVPRESGFSGDVNLGLGALDYESNLIASSTTTNVDTQSTTNLTSSPVSKTVLFPLFSFEARYTFGHSRTQLFAGTQVRDFLVLNRVFSLGVRQEAGNTGRFQVALLSTPTGSKAWQDPYVTGSARTSTAQTSRGLMLDWDRVFRTNFGIGFTSAKVDINDEASGSALVSAGTLTAAQAGLLDRNGTAKKIDVHYAFAAGPYRLAPMLSYVDESLDGKAMANTGYLLGMTLIAPLVPNVHLVGNLSYGRMTSDTVNPVFGEKYDKTHFGIDVAASYKNPFGLRHWTGSFIFGYFNDDNKIAFYDTRTILTALSMRYDF